MLDLIKQVWNLIFSWRTECEKGKNPIYSKTIWAIAISTAAVLSSKYVGINLSAEEQTLIVSFVGILMRFISKGQVGFYEDTDKGKQDNAQNQ